jgi:YYY domain-containing protein
MLQDWLAREGGAIIAWWVLALLAGTAAFPLLFRLMHRLPGRGYAFSRAAGLLLTGFVFWLLNNLGLLRNDAGGSVAAWLLVLTAGLAAYGTWSAREPVWPWLRRNLSLIVAVEALFAVMFLGWVVVRALNPDLTGTEKPMEMAFLSAVRRSATFPPHDPWFAGYAISYYHFGYILMGMLANLSGVGNGVAFNLAIPLLFALTGVGAFGVAYDLVASRIRSQNGDASGSGDAPERPQVEETRGPSPGRTPAITSGVLAAVFAVVMGNLGTALVEIPYQTRTASPEYLAWMNIEERDSPVAGCIPSGSGDPASWCFWWWFRHSRVVRDLELGGLPIGAQPITEFPQFSFILADMHPHVLALPWALLSIGLAFNLVMLLRRPQVWELALYAIFVGGMVFLNSWDAVYLVFLVGAEALRRLLVSGRWRLSVEDILGTLGFGLSVALLTGLFYLPFFVGFRSQAAGLVPNLIWQTQFQQFFLMFGPFLIILAFFLWAEYRRAGRTFNARLAGRTLLIGFGLALAALIALAVLAWTRADTRYTVFRVVDESGGLMALIPALAERRLHGLVTQGALLLAIFVIIGRLFPIRDGARDAESPDSQESSGGLPARPTAFALLCVAAGTVLTLVPEFAYLRDGFGVRINTVFKLYYQGWLFWSVASAFGLWSIMAEGQRAVGARGESMGWRVPFPVQAVAAGLITLAIALGMLYPPFAIISRALRDGGHLSGQARAITLDGAPSLTQGADEYAVIQCLAGVATRDNDVVAEATRRGLAYNAAYGRVSALTGIPTLLGWDNHQNQWRGETFGVLNTLTFTANGQLRTETRYDAIATLYNTTSAAEALGIIERYGITYIYVGPTERRDFSAAGLAKFESLTPVCVSGGSAVYAAAALRELQTVASIDQ